jgi:hypothetical protein
MFNWIIGTMMLFLFALTFLNMLATIRFGGLLARLSEEHTKRVGDLMKRDQEVLDKAAEQANEHLDQRILEILMLLPLNRVGEA